MAAGVDLRLNLLIQFSDWNPFVRRLTTVQELHLHWGASTCSFTTKRIISYRDNYIKHLSKMILHIQGDIYAVLQILTFG